MKITAVIAHQLSVRVDKPFTSSRGPAVDEAALTEALVAGRIRGAGLDVYEKQPLPRGEKPVHFCNAAVWDTHLARRASITAP